MTTDFADADSSPLGWLWLRIGLDVSALPKAARRRRSGESQFECASRVLRACGNAVRRRSLRTSSFAGVPVGSIVQLSPASGVAVVVRATRDRVWLETETDQRCVTLGEVDQLAGAAALDWHPGAQGTPTGVLARLVWHRRELRHGLSVFLLLSLARRLGMLGFPFLVRTALAEAIPDGRATSLWSIGAGVALLGLLIAVLGRERDLALRHIESHIVETYQRELFRAFQELPLRSLAQRPALFEWSQFSKFSRWTTLQIEWWQTCVDAVLGVPFLVATALLSLPAAAAAVAFSLACLLLSWQSARAQVTRHKHALEAREQKHDAVHGLVHGVELLRTDGLCEPMLAEFHRRARREHRADLAVADWRSFTVGLSNFAERAMWLGPFSVLGWQCMTGAATLATCIAAVQLVSLFAVSVRDAMGAIEKHGEIRSLETFAAAWAPSPSPAPVGDPAAGYAFEVKGVSFRYREDAPWVLEDFSLKMRRGEHRVLRWPSGAGKTTLLRIIAGVHEPDRGVTLVQRRPDGARDVCYVPQTTPLLEASLQENLDLLSGGAPAARIASAAKRTGLDELVATWPMGWETLVSGRVLSSGQRQLVTMTAVLASEASIVLLDETTAHLDASLRARLAGAFEGRTVLTVDHRSDLVT